MRLTADAAGSRIATIPIGKTIWHAVTELLRFGPEAEVMAPPELRDKMAELAQAMNERFRATASRDRPVRRRNS